VAEIERKVSKRGKRNALTRFVLAKGDKDKIAAWNQDLARVLRIFNVRAIFPVGIRELSSPLLDRAGNWYPRDGCGYPNDGCGYPSKYVDDAGRDFQPKPAGRCDLLSINNRILIIT
jgi:hypothetical protein